MSALAANPGNEKRFGKSVLCGHWDRLAETVRSIFPEKTALNLASISGLQPRTWEYFLYRKSSVSSDALVALLDTKYGPQILKALMGDSQERWWIQFKLLWERERMRAEIEALEKQLGNSK